MLVFNNKAICFNSTAIDFDYYNWQDIHPSFIKSQTKNSNYDLSAGENCGGLIVHLYTRTTAYEKVYSAMGGLGSWNLRYNERVPICYYSASNTPFVEPTQLMQKKYMKPNGLKICNSVLYENSEDYFRNEYIYSIKYSLSATDQDYTNYGAGYYVFDDSFLRRNNIPYVIEFTTRPLNTDGSGCAVWMGKLPYEYSNSAAYCCFNRCTFSSINNLDVKIDNTSLYGSPENLNNIFTCGEENSVSNITGLNNVKIQQNGGGESLRLVPNTTNMQPAQREPAPWDCGYLQYCNSVSSNKTLYCGSASNITNCTNIVTGTH